MNDTKNTYEYIKQNDSLQNFVKLIEKLSLEESLQSKTQYTVFAPTDEAISRIKNLAQEEGEHSIQNEELKRLVQSHMVRGLFEASELEDNLNLTTLSGTSVKISKSDSDIHVNGIKILEDDLETTNGVIHIIDGVIIPTDQKTENLKTIIESEFIELEDEDEGYTYDQVPEKPKNRETPRPTYSSGSSDQSHLNFNSNTTVIINQSSGPGCVVRALWFVFFGWWIGQIWIVLSWLAMITIIGIPLTIWMVNQLPKIITLKPDAKETLITKSDFGTLVEVNAKVKTEQLSPIIRIIYFLLIGWWFSFVWMQLAYLALVTIILIPLSFWMFNVTPATMTLKRG